MDSQKIKELHKERESIKVQSQEKVQNAEAYLPIQGENLGAYVQDKESQETTFEELYGEIKKENSDAPMEFNMRTALGNARVQEPPLDKKQAKKKRKREQKLLKQGRKLSPVATIYTVGMVKELEEISAASQKSQGQMSHLCQEIQQENSNKFSEKSEPQPKGLSSIQRYEWEQEQLKKTDLYLQERTKFLREEGVILESLGYFMPQLKLDKKGNATVQSQDRLTEFLQDCKYHRGQLIEDKKKEMMELQIDCTHFTPEYVGKHLAEVRQEVRHLRGYVYLFGDSVKSQSLTGLERVKVEALRETVYQAEKAYFAAVRQNGISLDGLQLQMVTKTEEQDDSAFVRLEESVKQIGIRKQQYIKEESQRCEEQALTYATAEIQKERARQKEAGEQWQAAQKARDLIEENPAAYDEEKQLADSLYQEICQLSDSAYVYEAQVAELKKMSVEEELQEKIQEKMQMAQSKKELLLRRIENIQEGLMGVLTGESISMQAAFLLRNFSGGEKFVKSMSTGEIASTQGNAAIEKTEEKKAALKSYLEEHHKESAALLLEPGYEAYAMLVKTGNETRMEQIATFLLAQHQYKELEAKVQEGNEDTLSQQMKELEEKKFMLAKTLVQETCGEVMEYTNEKLLLLDRSDKDAQLEMQEELLEMTLCNQALRALMEIKDVDNPGKTIKQTSLENRQELFDMVYDSLRGKTKQLRAYAIRKACLFGHGEKLKFTPEEQEQLGQTYDEKRIASLGKQMYINGYRQSADAREAYTTNPIVQEALSRKKKNALSVNHPSIATLEEKWSDKIKDWLELDGEKVSYPVACKKYYQNNVQKIALLKKAQEETTDVKEKEEFGERIKSYQRENDELEIWQTLQNKPYKTGEKTVLSEAMFRSFGALHQCESFRKMTDEEFFDMCRKLAAGGISGEEADDLEKKRLLEEKLEGIEIFKKHMREHYEYLEEKYHHSLPSFEYCITHTDEVLGDLWESQVDYYLTKEENYFIDNSKEDDVLLQKLTRFYHSISGAVANPQSCVQMGMSDEAIQMRWKDVWEENRDSAEYIQAHYKKKSHE